MASTVNRARQITKRTAKSAFGTNNGTSYRSRTVNGSSQNLAYCFNDQQCQFAPGKLVTDSVAINPLKALFRRQWNERDRSALLQWVHCPVSFNSHAVVRRYHARRVRQALVDALRLRAMNSRGKPLDNNGKMQTELDSPIKGSLLITLRGNAAKATKLELQNELRNVVERILHVQESRGS